jgi:hypothetical protein
VDELGEGGPRGEVGGLGGDLRGQGVRRLEGGVGWGQGRGRGRGRGRGQGRGREEGQVRGRHRGRGWGRGRGQGRVQEQERGQGRGEIRVAQLEVGSDGLGSLMELRSLRVDDTLEVGPGLRSLEEVRQVTFHQVLEVLLLGVVSREGEGGTYEVLEDCRVLGRGLAKGNSAKESGEEG